MSFFSKPYIIIGLGNPGKKYEHTRHNVGFDTINILSQRNGIDIKKVKHKAIIGEGRIAGQKVILAVPQTFMNLSGESVTALANWHKVPMENIIVVYDDIDLDLGKIRIRPSGSAGSHNGMKSIISSLGKDNFTRIRVGIGKNPSYMDLANYVLSKYTKEEEKIIYDGMCTACDSIEELLSSGINSAMNKYNNK